MPFTREPARFCVVHWTYDGQPESEEHSEVHCLCADLRAAVLAPLADLRPSTAQRLSETLRSWLLHQGRRDAVAAELHVHPQTVRYRMGQLRELYGERLDDPRTVLELLLALPLPGTGATATLSA